MIIYTVHDAPRRMWYAWLTAISLLITFGLGKLVETANAAWLQEWGVVVSAPGALGVFGIVFLLFDNFLWKMFWLDRLHKIPDLAGTWTGQIERAVPDRPPTADITVTITQTWTRIGIETETPNTRASAVSAVFNVKDKAQKQLLYNYTIVPKKDAAENRFGEGCQKVFIAGERGAETLSGPYHNSHPRKGYMKLTRSSAKTGAKPAAPPAPVATAPTVPAEEGKKS